MSADLSTKMPRTLVQARGRLDEAIENFQQALALKPSLKPDFPEARGGLGNALRLQDRPEEAASQYEKMLAVRPDDAGHPTIWLGC
jgi:tetratricopeptide (TPR) repeat protein